MLLQCQVPTLLRVAWLGCVRSHLYIHGGHISQVQCRCCTCVQRLCQMQAQSSLLDIVKFVFFAHIVLARFSKMVGKEKKIKGLERRKSCWCLEKHSRMFSKYVWPVCCLIKICLGNGAIWFKRAVVENPTGGALQKCSSYLGRQQQERQGREFM